MDLNDTPDLAEHRARVRAWLEAHKAEAPVGRPARPGRLAGLYRRSARLAGQLTEGGLNGVTWPQEYGGQGLGPLNQVVVNQEIAARGRPGHPRRDRRRHARADDHRPRH